MSNMLIAERTRPPALLLTQGGRHNTQFEQDVNNGQLVSDNNGKVCVITKNVEVEKVQSDWPCIPCGPGGMVEFKKKGNGLGPSVMMEEEDECGPSSKSTKRDTGLFEVSIPEYQFLVKRKCVDEIPQETTKSGKREHGEAESKLMESQIGG